MGKIYVCQDCNIEFNQKSHYDRHLKKKIPCVLKDKPLTDVINEAVAKQVLKIIKEENKNIIISSLNIDSDNTEKQPTKLKTIRKKPIKKNEAKDEIDYYYLRLPDNQIIFELDNNENDKNIKPILKMIDKAHNILFQAENIVGQKALQIIMSLLFLKLIQPYLSEEKEEGKIDLLNKEYYLDKYDDDEILDNILGYFKNLSNLTCQGLKTIRNDTNVDAIKQMGEILKRHPITKMIYNETNFIKVREASTIQTLINDVINKINFNDFNDNEDVIGEIYEHMLNKYVKNDSKELGQYFTPRKLMKLILSYKKERINELFSKINKKDKISICDPCMGTAGWLVSGYNMFDNAFKDRLNVSGGEVEPETFQYSLMNIILTLHRFPDDVQCNSSLTHVNANKHNLILTNPPFNSKKQIKFEQIEKNFNNDTYNKININDIYELKKDDPPIQFLELDTYKLEEDGLCIIVLPYGEFFSGNSFCKTRTHFLKTVNITDIILVPGGIFTHTGIKTCVMIYEKTKKGTDNINFSRINQDCDSIEKITTVNINDINKEPMISWYHSDYLNDNLISQLSKKMNNFEWIEFGKIFTLEKGKLQSSKVEEDEDGEGVFINWSLYDNYKKISKYSLSGENLFMSTVMPNGKDGGYIVLKYYNGNCDYGDLMSRLIFDDKYKNKINIKYVYHFLNSIKKHIETVYEKGSCNKSLDQKNFNRMKIQIPSIEQQNKCIEKINEMEEIIKRWENDIDNILNNGSNKFLEFLEGESIKYEKDTTNKEELEANSNIVKTKTKSKTKASIDI
jgi:type I restriction-modification system DNA methylase subunit